MDKRRSTDPPFRLDALRELPREIEKTINGSGWPETGIWLASNHEKGRQMRRCCSRHAQDRVSMALQATELLARGRFPDLQRMRLDVMTRRRQDSAVRPKRHATN